MEWESDSPCLSHTYPGLGHSSPGKHSSWDLEFGNCGAIPGWRVLLTVERLIERRWRRKIWWEIPVEESPAAMEARRYCWVMCRGWSHHHSLSFPTCHLQLNNKEGGASDTWCTELQSRTPARGAPLCAWRPEQQRRTPGKGALYVPEVGEIQRKTGQRGLLIAS